MQVLDTRCSALESESQELIHRVQEEVSSDRRRLEDLSRMREIELKIAAVSEEYMSQVEFSPSRTSGFLLSLSCSISWLMQ